MDDSEFQEIVDDEFVRIEDRVDELELDVDIDASGGVLAFTLDSGSSIILSRQVTNHEIWVAAKSGGFHLKRVDSEWFCQNTEESLEQLLNRVFSEQAGVMLF
ncbi:MAG: iron donor protein CyaY [Gammaproteobacteria bacterium]|nr:iron donor protein CyaY [Gammaproteobacteria bacterium]